MKGKRCKPPAGLNVANPNLMIGVPIEFTERHHDHVGTRGQQLLIVPKNLAEQTLGPIPFNGAPDPARGNDTQSA